MAERSRRDSETAAGAGHTLPGPVRADGGTADPSVCIVGAGVIGCAIADALAGSVPVTVLERDRIGGGATGRSAGEVTIPPVYSDIPSVATYAMRFFRETSGPETFRFHDRESVEFVTSERLDQSRRRAERLAEAGLSADFMSRVDGAAAYPFFDLRDYPGLLRFHDAGFLDPGRLVDFLASRARRRGAEFRTGHTVDSLTVRNGAVVGVETEEGQLVTADAVVIAAGWRMPRLLGNQVDLPVRPYRTQAAVVHLPALRDRDAEVPMGWVPDRRVYFRPMGGGDLLVGGFAAQIDEPAAARRAADPAFRRHVAALVPELFADAAGAHLRDDWAGVDLATPDTRPVIDALPDGPEGVLVATGFHGRGIMTAPVAGGAARARLLGKRAPFPLQAFSLSRFDSGDPVFPYIDASGDGPA